MLDELYVYNIDYYAYCNKFFAVLIRSHNYW